MRRRAHGGIAASVVAVAAALLACPGRDAEQSQGSGEGLSALAVPGPLLAGAAEAAARAGDFSRAVQLLDLAAAQTGTSTRPEALSVAEQAIAADQPEAARQALARVTPAGTPDFEVAGLALRIDDIEAQTAAQRDDVDRRARQLLTDVATTRPPVGEGTRPSLCGHLEALYWRRFEHSRPVAHRLDALSALQRICDRPEARRQSAQALRAVMQQAIDAGNVDDAVSALRVWIGLAGTPEGPSPEEAAQARDTLRELLWPTFLARRRERWAHESEADWIAAGTYDAATGRVSVEVEVPPGPSCADPADCDLARQAAQQAAHSELVALAREAGEIPEGGADPSPCVSVSGVELVNAGDTQLVFRAWAPLDDIMRALYDCER